MPLNKICPAAILVAAIFFPLSVEVTAQTDTLKTNETIKYDLIFTRTFEDSVEELWKAWSESVYVKQW